MNPQQGDLGNCRNWPKDPAMIKFHLVSTIKFLQGKLEGWKDVILCKDI